MKHNDPDTDGEVEKDHSNIFYQRAEALDKRSKRSLWLIIGILIGGISLFVSAGWIADLVFNKSAEASKRSDLDFITDRMNATRNSKEILGKKIETLNLDAKIKIANSNCNLEEFEKTYKAEIRQQITEAREDLKDLNRQEDDLTKMRLNLKSDLSQNEPQEQQGNKNQWLPTISVTTTRVGSIVLLIFLVQILVPHYRYNVRMSSYYKARGDALTIAQGKKYDKLDKDLFERLTKILSSETIDFGASPKSPAEQITELIKQAGDSSKPK